MADSAAVILCLFLSFSVASTGENVTSGPLGATAFDDVTYNGTVNVTDSDATTRPAEFEAPEPTPSDGGAEEPVQPAPAAEPLPLSGRLLPPATDVGRLCPCERRQDACDVNCCCDRECGEEVALFTSCSVASVSGGRQLCSSDAASYSLASTIDGYSQLQSSVGRERNADLLCVRSQNRVDVTSFSSPALPTDRNFDSLFQRFSGFMFGSEEKRGQASAAALRAPGYQYGDELAAAGEHGERRRFWLPAPGVTAECVDTSPAAFLKDQSGACSRRLVLDRDCGRLPALNMDTYANVRLFAAKNQDAAVVPVEASSVVLQALDGTQTELRTSGGQDLGPVLLNPDLCANVVLKVAYVVKYNAAAEIVNATVSLVLGFVAAAALPLKQEFHLTFIQEGEDVAIQRSGNPGYVVGLPLVSGSRTADGIVRSIDLRDTLSLLRGAEDQDCLQGPHRRTPVLFGLDFVSGCTLRLEDTVNCSLVSQLLLDVLRGQNYPQYVASFGNSPLYNPLDWVKIQNSFSPGEAQSCSVPLSLHLEVKWTKYGSLVNPQPQIVSVRETIQTNTTSLDLLSGGGGVLPIRTSVAFVPVSAAAVPGYRATPTIDAKLPFDFFFPFV